MFADIFERSQNCSEYINELDIKKKAQVLSRLEPALTAEYLRSIRREERAALIDLPEDSVKKNVMGF